MQGQSQLPIDRQFVNRGVLRSGDDGIVDSIFLSLSNDLGIVGVQKYIQLLLIQVLFRRRRGGLQDLVGSGAVYATGLQESFDPFEREIALGTLD